MGHMADAYPWGTQAPAARLTKLQRDLEKNTGAKNAQVESHRAAMARLESEEKGLKSDIRACEAIIEREQREAHSQQLSKLLQRMAGSGAVDLAALLADPELEKKIASIAQDAAQKGAGDAAKKPKSAKKADAGEPAAEAA
jgi:hypothetical protein